MICVLLIIFPYPAVFHVFQGPGFSGSRFSGSESGFRIQVEGPGSVSRVPVQRLGYRSSQSLQRGERGGGGAKVSQSGCLLKIGFI